MIHPQTKNSKPKTKNGIKSKPQPQSYGTKKYGSKEQKYKSQRQEPIPHHTLENFQKQLMGEIMGLVMNITRTMQP